MPPLCANGQSCRGSDGAKGHSFWVGYYIPRKVYEMAFGWVMKRRKKKPGKQKPAGLIGESKKGENGKRTPEKMEGQHGPGSRATWALPRRASAGNRPCRNAGIAPRWKGRSRTLYTETCTFSPVAPGQKTSKRSLSSRRKQKERTREAGTYVFENKVETGGAALPGVSSLRQNLAGISTTQMILSMA